MNSTDAILEDKVLMKMHVDLQKRLLPGEPHQRNPNAPKFEDCSQEETEWQEQGAREAAWKLAKKCV